MNSEPSKVQWTVWVGLLVTILLLAGVFVLTQLRPRAEQMPIYGNVTQFQLTNQFGETVTLDSFKGKIWVANIIFTSCPGPCANMTEKMSELQAAVSADAPVQFVSLTTDPTTDSPEVLKEYGERYRTDGKRWWFLTGEKDEIARLAGPKGLLLTAVEKPESERANENDLFIHSTTSVIVDRQGRVRGIVEALEPGAKERALAAIEQLLKE